jgi:hypothetical protein
MSARELIARTAFSVVFAVLGSAPSVCAEESNRALAPNSVYAEALGAGVVDSLNYERIVVDRFALRAGLGLFHGDADHASGSSVHAGYVVFPITASYVGVRYHMHALEVGGGVTIANASFGALRLVTVYPSGGEPQAFGVAFVGYRFHPEGYAGLQLRVGGMMLAGSSFATSDSELASINDAGKFGVVPWAYVSAGASF